jgi:hypothetical protein
MTYRWYERDNIGVLSPGGGPIFPAHNHSEFFRMRHTIFMDSSNGEFFVFVLAGRERR